MTATCAQQVTGRCFFFLRRPTGAWQAAGKHSLKAVTSVKRRVTAWARTHLEHERLRGCGGGPAAGGRRPRLPQARQQPVQGQQARPRTACTPTQSVRQCRCCQGLAAGMLQGLMHFSQQPMQSDWSATVMFPIIPTICLLQSTKAACTPDIQGAKSAHRAAPPGIQRVHVHASRLRWTPPQLAAAGGPVAPTAAPAPLPSAWICISQPLSTWLY